MASDFLPLRSVSTFDVRQFVNYGVQGGAPASHRNINSLLKEFGEDIDDAHLSVSFGKNEHHWSNYEDSKLQQRLQADIQRFGRLIKWISRSSAMPPAYQEHPMGVLAGLPRTS